MHLGTGRKKNLVSSDWSRGLHLGAITSIITQCIDVDRPGAICGGGHQVSAAALEVEVLLVKGPIMASAPRHACGRALRRSDAAPQTTADYGVGLEVCRGQINNKEQ